MEQQHHDQTACDIGVKFIVRIETHPNHTINQNKIQENDECTTDKAEVFTDNGKNHIGLTNRHINIAYIESFTKQATYADCQSPCAYW